MTNTNIGPTSAKVTVPFVPSPRKQAKRCRGKMFANYLIEELKKVKP